MTKHICLFSGGASSSYMSYIVSQKYGKENTILLHTPTYAEHEDANRFRKEISDFIGIPITVQAYGLSLWELIGKYKALPSSNMPFCTMALKIRQTEKFVNKMKKKDDFILYYGYGVDEWRRVQKVTARMEVKGWKVRFPIFEGKIEESFLRNEIKQWGIELPQTYKTLKHNNCIPCFKAGKQEWKTVMIEYPDELYKAIAMENLLGHTVFKNISLVELVEKWMADEKIDDGFVNVPCECVC